MGDGTIAAPGKPGTKGSAEALARAVYSRFLSNTASLQTPDAGHAGHGLSTMESGRPPGDGGTGRCGEGQEDGGVRSSPGGIVTAGVSRICTSWSTVRIWVLRCPCGFPPWVIGWSFWL